MLENIKEIFCIYLFIYIKPSKSGILSLHLKHIFIGTSHFANAQ